MHINQLSPTLPRAVAEAAITEAMKKLDHQKVAVQQVELAICPGPHAPTHLLHFQFQRFEAGKYRANDIRCTELEPDAEVGQRKNGPKFHNIIVKDWRPKAEKPTEAVKTATEKPTEAAKAATEKPKGLEDMLADAEAEADNLRKAIADREAAAATKVAADAAALEAAAGEAAPAPKAKRTLTPEQLAKMAAGRAAANAARKAAKAKK